MTVGSGDRRYELVVDWGALPDGWVLGQVGIGTDSEDNVFLYNRSEHPMIVLDRSGRFLASWGEGVLTTAHGIFVDHEDNLYLPVITRHVVMKCDREGHLLMTMGELDRASDPDWHGDLRAGITDPVAGAYGPFTLPTDVAVGADGSIFCTDGYGNARVHRFTDDGVLVRSWGEPGKCGPGVFHLPHGIWVHDDGRVFVVDRENNRIQIFTGDGAYLDEWTGFSGPCDIFIDDHDTVYVAQGSAAPSSRNPKDPDAFVCILTIGGEPLCSWPSPVNASAHALWVDSEGSIYVGQNYEGQRLLKYCRMR
jgi:hypothetical protein